MALSLELQSLCGAVRDSKFEMSLWTVAMGAYLHPYYFCYHLPRGLTPGRPQPDRHAAGVQGDQPLARVRGLGFRVVFGCLGLFKVVYGCLGLFKVV